MVNPHPQRVRRMSHARHRGISLLEVIVVLFVIAVLVGFLLPSLSRSDHGSSRTICSSNLAGIYKAMYTYSTTNKDKFPRAGASDPEGAAIGFAEGNRLTGDGAVLENNVTASLWMLVQDGSCGTKSFVCESDKDSEPDPLTVVTRGAFTEEPVILEKTFDFGGAKALSYSVMNMHDGIAGKQWNADVDPAWILMSDDNNANDAGPVDKAAPHTRIRAGTWDVEDLQYGENSQNHSEGEGQNFLFGDSHVSFTNDPFQGPSYDNAMALDVNPDPMTEAAAPPTLSNAAINEANRKTDVVLLPITGNGGGAGSLDPFD
ncbi:MAG: hypothetical protein GC159_13865 [Phycisphaera sp.]|nr:hypothetical protein [Phycisphaera sp.]